MEITWQVAPAHEWAADAGLLFTWESTAAPLAGFERWLVSAGRWLGDSPAFKDFRGEWQETTVLYGPPEVRLPRVVLVGLGATAGFDADKWRGAVATGVRKCREMKLARVGLPLWAFEGLPLPPPRALQEALIGGMNGLYRFDRLKTRDREKLYDSEELLLLTEAAPPAEFAAAVEEALAAAAGVRLARDLVMAPGNEVTPSFLVESARRLAGEYGFQLDVIDAAQARALGMGAFLAVAQGSREPAFVIVLENRPQESREESPLVYVGKGITFDTGGISIKPSERMELMKHDMAGAAAVLGAFQAIGRLGIQTPLVGIVPCTENMPDGRAYKPGDVIRSLAGLTIEVISTDAEGRMILCDALTYAQRFHPAAVIDLATLTGACIVALGEQVAGIMGTSEVLIDKLRAIGAETGERLWPLPLWDFYFDELKSDVADFKNAGGRKAGTISGAMFLKQFVPADTPWAHLDIAGPVWTDKDQPTSPKGATGFGVRLLVELARQWPAVKPR
jgi:leucyl aminopeptidase